jgi:catechol 2,3-dioxygenase-like lactoylglutathione lyase family enzyme
LKHQAIAIIPSGDLPASCAFYVRLGFAVIDDYGDYLILADPGGAEIHLRHEPGWPVANEDNPIGLYIYVDDVDAVANRVRNLIIEPGAPHLKPWGTYEFSISDPTGALVRIGKSMDTSATAEGDEARLDRPSLS